MIHDFLIVGGGIVGLAIAQRLQAQLAGCSIALVEKELGVAEHQTGRNSGVIHSGIYYKPGSLKAINCVRGHAMMVNFCKEQGIPFELTGKIIVATRSNELPILEDIFNRGQANGVPVRMISAEEACRIEPHVACIRGIHVASTGIVNYATVCEKLAQGIESRGGFLRKNFKVQKIESYNDEIVVSSDKQDQLRARYLINCAGLYCDHIARMMGIEPGMRIIPFRGEYFLLKPEKKSFCNTLIYPVPDPSFPFLGVHLTKMIDGSVECGPNAVFAFGREAYRKTDFRLSETLESLSYPGFQKLALRYWKTGLGEMYRSISKRAFVKALQRLIPDIRSEDLLPAQAGIRAQAISPEGKLVDDFEIRQTAQSIHILNAPSPAATASLSIAELVVEKICNNMGQGASYSSAG